MTTDPAAFRREVLLSFQRALWDLVTPERRAVAVKLSYPMIEARFIFEAVGDDEHEIALPTGWLETDRFRTGHLRLDAAIMAGYFAVLPMSERGGSATPGR